MAKPTVTETSVAKLQISLNYILRCIKQKKREGIQTEFSSNLLASETKPTLVSPLR